MRVYPDFFWYPDPDQRSLKRIRPNDTDPTGSGSGSETLIYLVRNWERTWRASGGMVGGMMTVLYLNQPVLKNGLKKQEC